MKPSILNNKENIEFTSNISSIDVNNVPCTIINISGTDHNNPKLQCVQSIGNISNTVNDSNPRTKLITSNSMILNKTNSMDISSSVNFSNPIINNQSAIIIADPTFVQYTVIPSVDGTLPLSAPIQPLCNLVNTGSTNNPILICKELIGINKNVTMLPPVVPAGCVLQNTGTQTKPLLKCQQILPPINQTSKSESPITSAGRTQTTGVASLLNTDEVTSGSQSSGALLSLQKSNNPYTTIISDLNKSTNWSCPAGYLAQYPDQALTDCDDNGCTDFYQNPAVLNKPCLGPANASYKYNKDPFGALDMDSNVQCEHGFPIYSGINMDGIFTGDVKCMYLHSNSNLI